MNEDQMAAFFAISKQIKLTSEQEDEIIDFIEIAIEVALAHERGEDK